MGAAHRLAVNCHYFPLGQLGYLLGPALPPAHSRRRRPQDVLLATHGAGDDAPVEVQEFKRGMAVISLDFSSVLTWPRVTLLAEAHDHACRSCGRGSGAHQLCAWAAGFFPAIIALTHRNREEQDPAIRNTRVDYDSGATPRLRRPVAGGPLKVETPSSSSNTPTMRLGGRVLSGDHRAYPSEQGRAGPAIRNTRVDYDSGDGRAQGIYRQCTPTAC